MGEKQSLIIFWLNVWTSASDDNSIHSFLPWIICITIGNYQYNSIVKHVADLDKGIAEQIHQPVAERLQAALGASRRPQKWLPALQETQHHPQCQWARVFQSWQGKLKPLCKSLLWYRRKTPFRHSRTAFSLRSPSLHHPHTSATENSREIVENFLRTSNRSTKNIRKAIGLTERLIGIETR